MFIVHEGSGWAVLTYEHASGVFHTMYQEGDEWFGPVVTTTKEAANSAHMGELARRGRGDSVCHACNN